MNNGYVLGSGFIVAIGVGQLLWAWRKRERSIADALSVRQDPKRIDADRPVLRKAVDLLVSEYGADTFASSQLTEVPQIAGLLRERVEILIELNARRWRVVPPPIQIAGVSRQDEGHAAGTFQESGVDWIITPRPDGGVRPLGGDGWTIRIDPAHARDAADLAVLVAHEFAHGVLSRDKVTLGDRHSDEVLTDVAAALIGFGQIMFHAQSRVSRNEDAKPGVSYSVGAPGYLWPSHLAYVLERHRQLVEPAVASQHNAGSQDGRGPRSMNPEWGRAPFKVGEHVVYSPSERGAGFAANDVPEVRLVPGREYCVASIQEEWLVIVEGVDHPGGGLHWTEFRAAR